ncbi:hypothetical protein CBS101457_001192 [Exobasidium rhododendri]|nr:hypothetical protein CBS101457_001192 [Exobasidium rhododendri]
MPATKKRQAQRAEKTLEVKSEIPLGKYLVSTEKKIRDGAIKSLASFLANSDDEPLSEAEMAKLWKGIFYCFWMSDKPRVQQALAQELADLLLTIKAPSSSTSSSCRPALLFLEGFYDAMVREWTGLDKWRVDKFYLLFRRFTNAAFRLLARQGWEEEGVSQFTEILLKEGGPLCSNDVKVPDGITYHLSDIYVEELDRAMEVSIEADDYLHTAVPALVLLQPFISTMATCHSPLVFDRICKAVILPFLQDCLKLQEGQEESNSGGKRKAGSQKASSKRRKGDDGELQESSSDDDDDNGETDGCQFAFLMSHLASSGKEVRKLTFEAIFRAASAKESIDARRRRLYKLCKEEEERLEDEED